MAEASEADDADLGAGADVPVAQGAVGGDARAEEGGHGGEFRLEFFGDGVNVAGVDHNVVRVAALGGGSVVVFGVVGADEALGAVLLDVGLAVFAGAAGVDHDAYSGQVAYGELGDFRADGSDAADDFVAGDHGVDRTTPLVADLVDVGVADAGEEDFDDDVIGAGVAALEAVGG